MKNLVFLAVYEKPPPSVFLSFPFVLIMEDDSSLRILVMSIFYVCLSAHLPTIVLKLKDLPPCLAECTHYSSETHLLHVWLSAYLPTTVLKLSDLPSCLAECTLTHHSPETKGPPSMFSRVRTYPP